MMCCLSITKSVFFLSKNGIEQGLRYIRGSCCEKKDGKMIVFTTVFFSRKYLSSFVAYCRRGGGGGVGGVKGVYIIKK